MSPGRGTVSETVPPDNKKMLNIVDTPNDLFEAEIAVMAAVDHVVEKGGMLLYDHYLAEREVPYATKRILADMARVVEWVDLPFDKGDIDRQNDPLWCTEEEPQPALVDTWARGAVPVKKKQGAYDYGGYGSGLGTPSEGQSTARSRGSKSTTRRGAPGSSQSKRATKRGMDKLNETGDPVTIIKMETPRDSRTEPGPGMSAADLELTSMELAHAQQVKDLEDKEKKEKDRLEALMNEEKEEAKRQERLGRELKGKEYTFDRDGSVILINQVNFDRVPAVVHDMDVDIFNLEEEGASDNDEKGKRKKGRKGQGKRNKARARQNNGTEDGVDDEYFHVSHTAQPSMLAHITLSAGVGVSEGGQVREGPARNDDRHHMSRKDFMLHQTLLETQSVADAPVMPNTPDPLSFSATTAGKPSSLMLPLTTPASPLEEVDVLAGARTPGSGGGGVGGLGPLSPASTAGGGLGGQAGGGGEDINLRLVGSPDWGKNVVGTPAPPAVLPVKPTPKQRELQSKLMGGPGVRNTRERPFITPGPLRHLPSPWPGVVTGHGVMTSGFQQGSGGGGAGWFSPSGSVGSRGGTVGPGSRPRSMYEADGGVPDTAPASLGASKGLGESGGNGASSPKSVTSQSRGRALTPKRVHGRGIPGGGQIAAAEGATGVLLP